MSCRPKVQALPRTAQQRPEQKNLRNDERASSASKKLALGWKA
jgi:hypothetical protein